MAMFEKLMEMKETGVLKSMVSAGLVSPKVYLYLEIYMWIDARKRTTKARSCDLAFEAMDAFNVSRATIFRAVKSMKTTLSISK